MMDGGTVHRRDEMLTERKERHEFGRRATVIIKGDEHEEEKERIDEGEEHKINKGRDGRER